MSTQKLMITLANNIIKEYTIFLNRNSSAVPRVAAHAAISLWWSVKQLLTCLNPGSGGYLGKKGFWYVQLLRVGFFNL